MDQSDFFSFEFDGRFGYLISYAISCVEKDHYYTLKLVLTLRLLS